MRLSWFGTMIQTKRERWLLGTALLCLFLCNLVSVENRCPNADEQTCTRAMTPAMDSDSKFSRPNVHSTPYSHTLERSIVDTQQLSRNKKTSSARGCPRMARRRDLRVGDVMYIGLDSCHVSRYCHVIGNMRLRGDLASRAWSFEKVFSSISLFRAVFCYGQSIVDCCIDCSLLIVDC